ncbi:hypothetical protein QQ045_007469 [Rhodiola kirilowii]
MIEDRCASVTIPIEKINNKVMTVVLKYCKMHVDYIKGLRGREVGTSAADLLIMNFEYDFIEIDISVLKEYLLCSIFAATDYLEIPDLQELVTTAIAKQIEEKSLEEVLAIFNIENDFTAKEESKMKEDAACAFELEKPDKDKDAKN